MKKTGKIIASVIISIMLMLTMGCSLSKEALDNIKFSSIMEEKKFTVIDVTDQYNNYDYISSVQVASSENNEFQIEFYKLNSVDNAKKMFESNKSDFEDEKSSSAFTSNVDMTNYNIFTLSDATSYRYICRVDDTLIYVNTTKEYQSEVKGIIETLGY